MEWRADVISVDPGGRYYASWFWDSKSKRARKPCFHYNFDLLSWPKSFRAGAFLVVIETQLRTKADRARRVDILALAEMTGAIKSRSKSRAIGVPPNLWKRQVSRDVSHKKILLAMAPEELQEYQGYCRSYQGLDKSGKRVNGMDIDMRMDVSHAWGVGAFYFRRFGI